MTHWIEWLLDLDNIRIGRDAPLMLEWSSHVEAWMLFCVALAVGSWIGLIYRRERTSIGRRIGLAVVRAVPYVLREGILLAPGRRLVRPDPHAV